MTGTERLPCPGCKRFHRGPRHKPEDVKSVNLSLTIPRWLNDRLTAAAPWGERSALIRRLLEEELGP